jgi:hypothetical protein
MRFPQRLSVTRVSDSVQDAYALTDGGASLTLRIEPGAAQRRNPI